MKHLGRAVQIYLDGLLFFRYLMVLLIFDLLDLYSLTCGGVRGVCVWYFTWQRTAEQLLEVLCPPCLLFLLMGEHSLCYWLWQSVCDLCNTFQCSSDDPSSLSAASSACLVRSSRKFLRYFCDAFCILVAGFAVFDLGFCFVDPCSPAIQYLIHLRSDFSRLQCLYLHRCWAVPCMFQASPHLVNYCFLFPPDVVCISERL